MPSTTSSGTSTFWYSYDAGSDSYDTQADRYRCFLLELLAQTFDGPIASYALAVKAAIANLWLSPLAAASIVIELSGPTAEHVRFFGADGREITELPAQAR